MSTIFVNGKRITVEGGSISIRNGEVFVDGKIVESGLSGIVEIKWEGPLASLEADGTVTCGDVSGPVQAGGNVNARNIQGNVNAGGNVNCGDVTGKINAGGNVNRR